jgi:hypothetical protein
MNNMATKGPAFFDAKGQYFRTAREATCSDLAALLGRIGEGDSLAPGLANTLFEKRAEIEQVFAEHDALVKTAGDRLRVVK